MSLKSVRTHGLMDLKLGHFVDGVLGFKANGAPLGVVPLLNAFQLTHSSTVRYLLSEVCKIRIRATPRLRV